jgi:hypothetical protein
MRKRERESNLRQCILTRQQSRLISFGSITTAAIGESDERTSSPEPGPATGEMRGWVGSFEGRNPF